MNFDCIELTFLSGIKVFININNIVLFYDERNGGTAIEFPNEIIYKVRETPTQIFEKIQELRRYSDSSME